MTSLSEGIFSVNSLESIEIPNTITSIGDTAFAVNSLVSVVIPDSVTSIGSSAFLSNNLTSVTIGSGITSIGSLAFYNNNTLSSICIERAAAGMTLGSTEAFPTYVTAVDYQSDGDCYD